MAAGAPDTGPRPEMTQRGHTPEAHGNVAPNSNRSAIGPSNNLDRQRQQYIQYFSWILTGKL